MAKQLFVKTSPSGWNSIADLFVKTAPTQWASVRDVWVKVSPTLWSKAFSQTDLIPYYTVAPTLSTGGGLESYFTNGDTITLTRGTWANTSTAFAPISYSLAIQYSTDNVNWYDQTTGTGTTLSYTITLTDARSPSTYFRGKVQVTNKNGSSTAYYTTPVRSTINLTVSGISATIVSNQIYVLWTTDPANNSSNISNQLIEIKTNVPYTYNGQSFSAYQTVHSVTIPPGTNYALFGISGTNIKPSTSVYALVTITANDSDGTQDSGYSADFTSPILVGTIGITPSFSSPDRVESGATLTAVPSGWPSGTTFSYTWYRTRAFQPADDILLGSGSTTTLTTSSSVTGERVFIEAYGTYDGVTSSLVSSPYHRIIPTAPSFTLGGGSGGITITSVTSTGAEYYFGTYSGPTSGTIPQTNIGTDYVLSGLSSGTYTVTLYAGAINGNPGYEITTESNSSTSVSKSVTILSAPTPYSGSFSNGTFYIYFSGGSGPYYQVWYNTSSTPGSNNPNSLGVTSYDFNGSSSPIAWTPSFVSYGTTYNFWIRSSNSLTTTTPGDYSSWSTAYVQVTPPISAPTATSVSGSAGNHNVYFSGGSGPYYQTYWYPGDRADIQSVTTYDASGTSSPINVTNLSVPTSGTTYYFWVRSVNSTTYTGTASSSASAWSNSVTWTAPVVQYTITWDANGGSVSPSSNTVNSGTLVTAPTPTRSGYTFNGWFNSPSGGSYMVGAGGTYTVNSTQTLYAQWTSTFTPPSSSAPALQFLRTTSTSRLDWYCDYPGISGNGSFTGMQFEIRTTAGGGTLLASGTRAYPGAGVYPYSAAGTIWAFRMGTANGDISYSSSARYGRARTVMLGTNGTTYYSAWTGWI